MRASVQDSGMELQVIEKSDSFREAFEAAA